MIAALKGNERGHANHGWLDTFHSFSSGGDDTGPGRPGFRALRVINEDRIAGGGEWGMHPHRDMEILTYVLSGALLHRDNLGNLSVMKAGEALRMTAGRGIEHSETNYSRTEPVHLLQVWIAPDEPDLPPECEQKSFVDIAKGALTLMASRSGREGSMVIHQDVDVLLGKLNGRELEYGVRPGRGVWLQVTDGSLAANGVVMAAGDGAAISDEAKLRLTPLSPANFLLFDLQ